MDSRLGRHPDLCDKNLLLLSFAARSQPQERIPLLLPALPVSSCCLCLIDRHAWLISPVGSNLTDSDNEQQQRRRSAHQQQKVVVHEQRYRQRPACPHTEKEEQRHLSQAAEPIACIHRPSEEKDVALAQVGERGRDEAAEAQRMHVAVRGGCCVCVRAARQVPARVVFPDACHKRERERPCHEPHRSKGVCVPGERTQQGQQLLLCL
mmetsp:Transcript_42167/g.70138  ORF Transcript_42167/g.70138 Transcript_42167/m.70138 type:complete len:208 (-) Transcript_42167:761-1384(-)